MSDVAYPQPWLSVPSNELTEAVPTETGWKVLERIASNPQALGPQEAGLALQNLLIALAQLGTRGQGSDITNAVAEQTGRPFSEGTKEQMSDPSVVFDSLLRFQDSGLLRLTPDGIESSVLGGEPGLLLPWTTLIDDFVAVATEHEMPVQMVYRFDVETGGDPVTAYSEAVLSLGLDPAVYESLIAHDEGCMSTTSMVLTDCTCDVIEVVLTKVQT